MAGFVMCACALAEPPAAPSDAKPTFILSQFAPGAPMRLVAYGDSRFTDPKTTSGTNPHVRQWLVNRIAAENPSAVLMTGDTPFTGALKADWAEFQKESAIWREQHIIELPTTGNHEIKGGREQGLANYLAAFPELKGHHYYSALLGSVEVIALDCVSGTSPSSIQGRWFAAQLDHLPPQVEFLLILYHIPWMADRQSQLFVGLPTPDALSLRGMLEARLAKIHAQVVVFNGHIHNYERFERNGVEYVVTGGGGAEPYPLLFRGSSDLYRDLGFPVYNYLTLDFFDHKMHAVMWKVKNPDGDCSVEAKDEFTLHAPQRAPAEKSSGGAKAHTP